MSTRSRDLRWGCLLCKNRKNPLRATQCNTCQTLRQQERFALQIDGVFYLAKVDLTSNFPSVNIIRVSPSPEICIKVLLPINYDTLEECVREAISHSRRAFETIKSRAESRGKGRKLVAYVVEDDDAGTLEDENLSLFDKVLFNATQIAYDAAIGRYVPKETIKTDRNGLELISFDLKYVKFMEREHVEMGRQVTEIIKRREDTVGYHIDFDVHSQRLNPKQACALCEYEFPKAQLLGKISFKAVANWKQDHGVPVAPEDHRLSKTRVHDVANLCLFCTHFFDENFGETIEESAIEESIGIIDENRVRGHREYSNKVFKRLMKQMSSTHLQADRPLSRMQQNIAIDHLKLKAESNSNLRFQFNPKNTYNQMVDQESAGKLLRNKYTDVRTEININIISLCKYIFILLLDSFLHSNLFFLFSLSSPLHFLRSFV